MRKTTKSKVEKEINEFFKDIKNKNPKEVKKIKRLAMHYNIKLGDKRKTFCKKCFSVKFRVKSIKNKKD